jgi:hypothetical protein
MGRRYQRPVDGEVLVLRGERGLFGHKVMCCDCGLVHRFVYRMRSGSRMEFAAWRDNRATAARRRRKT